MSRFYLQLIALTLFVLSPYAWAENDSLGKAQQALNKGDYQTAYTLYLPEANAGNSLAEFTIGLFYHQGWGQLENQQTACLWFEKAAEGEVPAAQQMLAACYENGNIGQKNIKQAIYWYEKSAESGIHSALCSIGDLYIAGEIEGKTVEEGIELCKKAAAQGVGNAAWRVGKLYYDGEIVDKDFAQAQQYLGQAANNQPKAAYLLAQLLEQQSAGSPEKTAAARYWYEFAASQGVVSAYYPTAVLYYVDESDAAPQAKAYMWLKATIERSELTPQIEESQKMLAELKKRVPPSWYAALDTKVADHLEKF